MDKRGQFFSLYMVFVTLFMAGVVSMAYFSEQKDVAASVVSPVEILTLRDDLNRFEANEKVLILDSLEGAAGGWGSQEFADSFRGNFLNGIDEDMKSFLAGASSVDAVFSKIYSSVYFDGSELVFVRGDIEKSGNLKALNLDDRNFQVDYVFDFGRVYRIRKTEGGFVLEADE